MENTMATVEDLSKLVDMIRNYQDLKSTSLSQYTNRCNISSRAYIQDEIAEEAVVGDVLKNIQNIYVGWILSALQMDTYVADGRKVRDLLRVVSTESFKGDTIVGVENFFSTMDWINPKDPRESYASKTDKQSKTMELKDVSFPSGRIIQVNFNTVPNVYSSSGEKVESKTITVDIFVQLLPRILPSEVCEQLIALNFTKEMQKRWLQYKAGELRFWKDFIFQFDILSKRRKALKQDKSGDLKNILDTQRSALFRNLIKFFQFFNKDMSAMQNIANSIIILDKRSFDKYSTDAGLNFKRHADRQKFFNKAYAMIVAVIDPMYNRVEMYINGVDAKAIYTYKQMSSGAKSDKVELVEMMAALNQGQSPRF
jgi:hypothetical protein